MRHLSYFVALAEERSFTRAAARLHIAQPSLSTQINRLEQFLGFPLFLRSTRAVELTPEGEKILAEARATIAASTRLLELTRQLRDGAEATVRVGAASLTAFRPERKGLFDAMEKQLPEITFEFLGKHQVELLEALRRWQIDISFHVGFILDDDDEFEHLVIKRLPIDLLVNAASPLARGKTIPFASLRDMPIALFAREHSPVLFDQLTEVLGKQGGARLIVPTEAHPFLIALYAAEHNMAAIHVEWIHHGQMLPPELVQRPFAEPAVFVEMSLVRLRRRPHKRGVDLFWRAAERYLQIQNPQL